MDKKKPLKITPRFKPGEEAYFIHNYQVQCEEVNHATIYVLPGQILINYHFLNIWKTEEEEPAYIVVQAGHCFKTLDLLLEKLRKDFEQQQLPTVLGQVNGLPDYGQDNEGQGGEQEVNFG